MVHKLYLVRLRTRSRFKDWFYGSDVKFVVSRLAALGITGTVVIELRF